MRDEELDRLLGQIASLSRSDLHRLGAKLPSRIQPEIWSSFLNTNLGNAIGVLPREEKGQVLRSAIEAQPEHERAELSRQVAAPPAMPLPTDRTLDRLWLIVVAAFAIVLAGSFVTLSLGVFIQTSGDVNPALVLTMFTSVVGFLAGLFVPSPLINRTSSGERSSTT